MVKKKFKVLEKFVVWQGHGKKCYLCGEPVHFLHSTVDHLIAEENIDNQNNFNKLKETFKLPDNFCINNFENWKPCHSYCNSRKGTRILTSLEMDIQDAINKAPSLKAEYIKFGMMDKKSKILATFFKWIENEELTFEDLSVAFQMLEIPYALNINKIDPKELKYIPEGWYPTGENIRIGMIHVVSGSRGGLVPATSNPAANEWECQRCHSYGPWTGAMCLTCGARSGDHLE